AIADRGQDRVHVQVLVGGHDHGVDLWPRHELAVVLRHKIGADLVGHEPPTVVVLLCDPDPLDGWMARGGAAAKQPYSSSTNDAEPDLLRLPDAGHDLLISAIRAACSFDSGNGTGPSISAERSAARYVSITTRALSAVTTGDRSWTTQS